MSTWDASVLVCLVCGASGGQTFPMAGKKAYVQDIELDFKACDSCRRPHAGSLTPGSSRELFVSSHSFPGDPRVASGQRTHEMYENKFRSCSNSVCSFSCVVLLSAAAALKNMTPTKNKFHSSCNSFLRLFTCCVVVCSGWLETRENNEKRIPELR